MTYLAIMIKKDHTLLSGIDFRYFPPYHTTADAYHPPLLIPKSLVCQTEIERQEIDMKKYKIVTVEISEVDEDLTNGDKIREMSDKELAECLFEWLKSEARE